MTNNEIKCSEFVQEQRYYVAKVKDAFHALSFKEHATLQQLLSKVDRYRTNAGKHSMAGVFVECDWPEHDVVWKMIEDRMVAGKATATQQDDQSKDFDVFIKELCKDPEFVKVYITEHDRLTKALSGVKDHDHHWAIIPEHSDVFTIDEFKTNCEYGAFTPDDGCGYWATGIVMDHCANVWSVVRPAWATHVVWFNR
jgi:hypothetical protein